MTEGEVGEGQMLHEGAGWVMRITRNRCEYIAVETFEDASGQKVVTTDRTLDDDHSCYRIIDDAELM